MAYPLAGVVLCAVLSAGDAPGPFLAPETALALQHLRAEERARAESALGPLEALPLYRVDLEADPGARTVDGSVEREQWVSGAPVTEVLFQLTPNAQEARRVEVDGVTVNGRAVDVRWVDRVRFRVPVVPAAEPQTTLRIRMKIHAVVPTIRREDLGGFLAGAQGKREATDYGAFGASPQALSLVGLIPRVPSRRADGAPRDGPSGLGDLALYDPEHLSLSVRVPRGYEVQSTGIPLGEVPDGAGQVRFSFAAAVARDFPLFVTQGYEHVERKVGDVTISVHHAPDHADAAKRVLGYTVAAIAEMEKRLGPLPYRRFRVVEAPLQSGAGGMEFPGLISISSNLLSGGMSMLDSLGIPPELTPMVKQLMATTSSLEAVVENTLEFTVAHEVAHQYFAGLVGSDPVAEPAVDETLAQYAALLYLEWKRGKEASDSMRNGQVVASYQLFRMVGGVDGAVERPTADFATSLEYAALVYGKGPLLHEAERKLMGDRAFVQGLRRYVDTYRFRWACRDCLTRVLGREAPSQAAELQRLRKRWWEEAHGDEDLGTLDSMATQIQGQALDPNTQKLMDEVLGAFEK